MNKTFPRFVAILNDPYRNTPRPVAGQIELESEETGPAGSFAVVACLASDAEHWVCLSCPLITIPGQESKKNRPTPTTMGYHL